MNVKLGFSHSQGSDLEITITAPSGRYATLIARGGASASALGGGCDLNPVVRGFRTPLVFDDESAYSFGTPPGASTSAAAYVSQGSDHLGLLRGWQPSGVWTLTIRDHDPLAHDGALKCWALEVQSFRLHSYLPLVAR